MPDVPATHGASISGGLREPAFDPNAMRVLKERYFAKKPDGTAETPSEFVWRVASAIAQPERPYALAAGRDAEAVVEGVSHAFYDMMAQRDFLPNTPCLVNAGRTLSMLSACFVLPVPDSIEGIFYNLKAMALIQKSGGGCVASDSRVWTTFCGLEPIEVLFNRATIDGRAGVMHGNGVAYDVADLGIKTVSMEPATGRSGLKDVTHVWKFDVPANDQVMVTTREGVEVQTSAWHPFMILRGTGFVEARADELSAGDVILAPERPDAYWPWKAYRDVAGLTVDEDIGWLIGFTLGDGSFGYVPALRQERLRWFSGDRDVLDKVRSILRRSGIDVGMGSDPRGACLIVQTLTQSFVASMLAACGFVKGGPKDARIRIPEHIAKSPLSVVRAFVAGLLDSDGCVDPDGSPSYTTVSKAMAHDLAALMSLLGYQPTMRSKAPHGKGKQTTYTVILCRLPQVGQLAADIGSSLASERRRNRLRSDSTTQTSLALPFALWRDVLKDQGLVQERFGRTAGAVNGAPGPLADELSKWSCNAAGRIPRYDLRRIAEALAPGAPELSALLTAVAERGQEVRAVSRATTALPYYDLTVADWNTYAAGRTGMTMIHNTGFAFSQLRHQGAEVESTGKDASGPVSFMKVFNAATDSIKQGGVRRGANMGVLTVDHPDIFHFMSCKKELDAENRALWNRMSDTGRYTDAQLTHMQQELLQTQINNFNISVGVTDAFMKAVQRDGDFHLRDPRTHAVVRTVKAREIWDAIIDGAWQNGEPGILFLDHPDVNPLPGLGPIHATNPCVTAETLVAVADGRGHVPIGELAASGKDVPVFCLDGKGAVTVRTMRHPRKTGDQVAVYRVTLDDGSILRATANHKFRLRDGAYREVRDLQSGDSLAIMTKFLASIKDVFPGAKSRSQEYWWINNGRAAHRLEHRYIAEFAYDTPISSGYVVHHRDYNAQNNAPGNLAIMTRTAHDALHREDKLGDRNPLRHAQKTWSAGTTNEQLQAAALELTRNLGRRFSTLEWEAYARERGLPERFSGWRRAHLNGSIKGLSTWAAQQLDFIANVDPRVMRHFEEALAQGYDAQIVGGVLLVIKRCELCDAEFSVPHAYREVGRCSRACQARHLSADPSVRSMREASRKVTLKAKANALREEQVRVYLDVQARESTAPRKAAWVAACEAQNVSCEISRKSSPFHSYEALQEAAPFHNHRVARVEHDGYEDVYNGTVDEFHNFFHGGFSGETTDGKLKHVYVNSRQCGEQFLHGYDSCNLGSINVGHFFDERTKDVDWERLARTTALALRFLDNVIDANLYPIGEIRAMVTGNRRVGLGIMGFAELLIKLEVAYGSPEAVDFAGKLMAFIQARAVETSETLARERGDFPNKHLSIWANDPKPRRNAALLSIAPTGTISMIAGCAFGCEPYFGMAYTKHVMKDAEGRPQQLYYVIPLFEEIATREGFFSQELLGKIEENRGSVKGLAEVPLHWQNVFTASSDVTVDQHIDMLAAFQKYTCNAVSKTINAPNADTKENVSRAIFRAYEAGCKGFTYYRDGSRTEQVVTFSKDGDLEGGNRDVAAATPLAAPIAVATAAPTDTTTDVDIAALLAKANALLEVR